MRYLATIKLSARNQLKGKISSVKKGGVVSRVELELTPASIPVKITSVITNEAVEELNLKPGDQVVAVMKSTEVMIAKLD